MATPTLTAVTSGAIAINDIVSFNWDAGRRAKSENFKSGTGSFTIRNPQNLNAAVTFETLINISINSEIVASGYVTDISYSYGMVQSEDTATISLEGFLSFMGRGYLRNFLLGGGTTGFEAERIGNALTGGARTVVDDGTRSFTFGPTQISSDAQSILLGLVATEQGRLQEGATSLIFLGRDVTIKPTDAPYSYTQMLFTDTSPATTGIGYDVIEFARLTDNYFTQVTVVPDQLTEQQAGTGARNLQINSYDETNDQALELAQYTLGTFNSVASVPVSISTRNSLQWALDPTLLIALGVGVRLPIVFRGTTYNTVTEGWSISATPDDVRYTFYVSGEQQNSFFILDDPIYGVLDNDKLSF
jgi:hypothetical protein